MSITVTYDNKTISQLSEAGTITLPTKGTFCESNVIVGTNYHVFDLDLTNIEQASEWCYLMDLPSDIARQINNPSLHVTFAWVDDYKYQYYSTSFCTASNIPLGTGLYGHMYGISVRTPNNTATMVSAVHIPPNNTEYFDFVVQNEAGNNVVLGFGGFRLIGNKYYYKPSDGLIKKGKYRLTFFWREPKNILKEVDIIDKDGSIVADGYKRGYATVNGSTTVFEAQNAFTATGLIKLPYAAADTHELYVYGLDFSGTLYNRINFYEDYLSTNTLNSISNLQEGLTSGTVITEIKKITNHYYKISLSLNKAKYISLSGVTVPGIEPVIWFNEPCF